MSKIILKILIGIFIVVLLLLAGLATIIGKVTVNSKIRIYPNLALDADRCQKCEHCNFGNEILSTNIYGRFTNNSECIECSSKEDCAADYACQDEKCLPQAEYDKIIADLPSCLPDEIGGFNCSHVSCDNCILPHPGCWLSVGSELDKKCLGCQHDKDCYSGYQCKNYSCVIIN